MAGTKPGHAPDSYRVENGNSDATPAALGIAIDAAATAFSRGKIAEAAELLQRAAQSYPSNHLPVFWLGTLLARIGRHAEAAAQFHRALALQPTDIPSLKGFVMALVELRRFGEAERPALALRERAPGDAIAHVLLSCIYADADRVVEAVASAEEALRLEPTEVAALLQLAQALTLLDRDEDAIAVLTRAKWLDPENLVTNLRLGKALKSAGHLERAREQFRAILESHPEQGDAHYELSEIESFSPGDDRIAAMEAALARTNSQHDARHLHFALGKAYDDGGAFDKAFPHFAAANRLEREAYPYDEPPTIDRINRTIETFSSALMKRLNGAGVESDAPIFIVGMPRSGTTLVEQILASHDDVAAGGEVDLFGPALRDVAHRNSQSGLASNLALLTAADATMVGEEYIKRIQRLLHGRRHLTDKQLMNRRFVGLIHLALPNAKIIHCLRDPVDTCLSAYMKPFGPGVAYASDLGSLGRYYRRYEAMMQHWREVLPPGRMLEVRYEDTVNDVEGQARRIVAHCGLEWQPQCLEFYRIRRPIRTASVAQVRQPIYRTSLGRWHSYERFLQPLVDALDGK